jgi:hypothetical protein
MNRGMGICGRCLRELELDVTTHQCERNMCSCGNEAWMHVNSKHGPQHLCRRCYALHSRRRDMRSPSFDYDRTDYVFPQRWRALTQTDERDMEID